jgi:hypothetical protein
VTTYPPYTMESRAFPRGPSQASLWPGEDARLSTNIRCFTIKLWASSEI